MSATVTKQSVDQLSVNAIRFLAVDMVQKADSGHPGLPLDAAPMAYVLWNRFLKHNPTNPKWVDRDRFVLSAGHGSALLYSLLYLTGYDVPMEQIQQFRQWQSITPGHPERGLTPGVEITTGPLGQGFANGVGMAMAEAHLAARYNRPGYDIINHYTYGIVSDGDLMEGVASEAASLGGHLQLGKLIYFYDNNHISLAAETEISYTEDVAKRFDAYGWQTIIVNDGNDLEALAKSLQEAQADTQRPTLILVHTHLGYGSPKQDTFEAHGSPLGDEDVKLTKEKLGWPDDKTFYVPDEVLSHFREAVQTGKDTEAAWEKRIQDYRKDFPDLAEEFSQVIAHQLKSGWDANIPIFPADEKGIATRASAGQVLNAIAPLVPMLMGGSADLNPSTNTALKGMGDFEPEALKEKHPEVQGAVGGVWSFAGRNIAFGVREHAMGAIANGMAAHGGIIPYTATFFNFSDYMKPSIRLACLMDLQAIFVFTHDSIGLGEDGPTHQPVEQLAMLRAMPRLQVIRPGDANESAVAWKVAVKTQDRPTALVLSRQKIPTLDRSIYASADGLTRGGYVLLDSEGTPDIILIATGSEVQLIVEAQQKLKEQNINARLVSLPCWEIFDNQPEEYRHSVLLPNVKARLAVEAGAGLGWAQYVGDQGEVVAVEDFGQSAPGPLVFEKYGFSVANVCKRALKVLKKG